jgi:hypothetical protein
MSDRLSELFKLQHDRKECSKCSNASFFLKCTSNLLVRSAFFLLNAAFAMAILDLTVRRSPRISQIRVTFDRLFPCRCNKCARVLPCSCLCCFLKACDVGFVIPIAFVWLYLAVCVWEIYGARVRVRLHLKCDGTRAETTFRLSGKRTSPFTLAGWGGGGGGVSSVDYWQPRCAHVHQR